MVGAVDELVASGKVVQGSRSISGAAKGYYIYGFDAQSSNMEVAKVGFVRQQPGHDGFLERVEKSLVDLVNLGWAS